MGKLRFSLVGVLGILIFGGSTQVYAQHTVVSTTAMRSVSGVIDWIDIKNGRMQISDDGGQDTRGISKYTVNLSKTLVTDTTDRQYLVIKDLEPGQRVVVELVDSPKRSHQDVVARNIIVDSTWENADIENTAVDYGNVNEHSSLVGPRGSIGPAGPQRNQGVTGPRGQSGVVLRGPSGERGPAGPAGEQGFTGPRGPAGDLARGPAGEIGPSGPMGQRGEVGRAGEQGGSSAGFAGPVGVVGPRGERGPVGDAGSKGPTFYGPAGPAGYAGQAGRQGAVGDTGAKGATSDGIAGLAGSSGLVGPRGDKGATGNQGVVGMVGHWEPYTEFSFAHNQTSLSTEDLEKVDEIAAYLEKNPSLQIGIDGTAVRSADQRQNDQRVNAIGVALRDAGVSQSRIRVGALGASGQRREGRIPVFFTTI